MTGAPHTPNFQQIQYTTPQPLQQAQTAINVPQAETPQQIGQGAQQFESTLPDWLQLTNYDQSSNPSAPGGQGGPFDQNLMSQMSSWYYNNYVAPQVSQQLSQNQATGMGYGTSGGAAAGQLAAQGQQEAFQAALQANQQEYQDVLQGRQSYLSGGPNVAMNQNQLDVNRGLQISNMENQRNMFNTGQANDYNLAAANMANNFMTNQYVNPNALAQDKYQDEFQNTQYNNSLIGGAISGGLLAGGSIL